MSHKKPLAREPYVDHQNPGFQWYAHDPFLGKGNGGASAGANGIVMQELRKPQETPERFTWKRFFRGKYQGIAKWLQ